MPLLQQAPVLVGGSSGPATITYVTHQPKPGNGLTVRTYTGVSLGTEAPDRIIFIVAGVLIAPGSGQVHTGVTVNGSSATKIIESNYDHGSVAASAIFAVALPTGTSATVAVTTSTGGTYSRGGMGCFAANGTGLVPYDTAVAGAANNPSASIDVPKNGFIIGGVATHLGSVTSLTGLTQRYNEHTSDSSYHSGACDNFADEDLNRQITANAGGHVALALASFGPA